MKKHKVVAKYIQGKKKYGVIDKNNNEFVIPCIYKSVDIHLDMYFEAYSENTRVILNNENKIIFNFSTGTKKCFVNNKECYSIFCFEIQPFNNALSYYGENILNKTVNNQICKITIKEDKFSTEIFKKEKLEPFF